MQRQLLHHHEAANLDEELLEGIAELKPIDSVEAAVDGAGEAGEGLGQPLAALALGLAADEGHRQLTVLLLPAGGGGGSANQSVQQCFKPPQTHSDERGTTYGTNYQRTARYKKTCTLGENGAKHTSWG